jgi:hypothetical protein
VSEYGLPGLSTKVETLSNRPSARRIALTADGSFMAVGLALNGDTPGVDIFNDTRTTSIHWITFTGATGAVRALAFSADSSKLFVVTQPDSGPPQFFVVDRPTLAASQLTLSPTPSTVSPGNTVQLQGILNLQDGVSASGASVDITETRPDSSTTDLGPVTVGSGGVYTLPASDELSQLGTYTFAATYAGDGTHLGSTATTTVSVVRGTTTLTLHGSTTHITYGQGTTLTAHLASAPVGSVVTITRNVNGVKSTVTSRPTNAARDVVVTVKPGENTVYSARFAGTPGYGASSSGTVSVVVSPVLSGGITKPYATQGGYRLYHYNASCATSATSCPVFTITFTPAFPGHLVYAIVQQATASGGWRKVVQFSGTLGTSSKAAIKLRYTKTSVIGPAFRVYAQYPGGPRFGGANKGYWNFKITR